MDFKVDMFVPMDISRVPCHSRSGFSLKDTLIPKRPQRFDVDVVSCVDNVGTNDFAAVGSTRTGSSVADDVEEQWPINERVCGLCGGDDASGARMVGTCWDGKSLSDEVCCDYDGQVHMNTRIRLEAIRPLLLTSTFQLLSNSIHLHFLSISMGAYVLQGPMDATSFGCC